MSAEPAGQAAHAAPLAPHDAAVGGVTQEVPLQQPLAHDAALHTHAPAMHCWPIAHIAPAPQRHAPLAQLSALVASHAMHTPASAPQKPVLAA